MSNAGEAEVAWALYAGAARLWMNGRMRGACRWMAGQHVYMDTDMYPSTHALMDASPSHAASSTHAQRAYSLSFLCHAPPPTPTPPRTP